MADFEQKSSSLAGSGGHAAPCQILHLVQHRGVGYASPTPFLVQAYVDNHAFTATAETAKHAFAKAIEWHVVGKLTDVSISDSTRSYSITEFSSVMALAEIANTIEIAVKEGAQAKK
jgi:hypothetical protein